MLSESIQTPSLSHTHTHYQLNVWTPTHSRVFLCFDYFLHCSTTMKYHIWNHVVPKNGLNKQVTIYLRFFKVATLCLDDSVAYAWHCLNQLHLECVSNSHQQSNHTPSYHLLHASRWETHMQRSSIHLLCVSKTRRLEPKISNLDSSYQRTDFHRSNVLCSCFLAQASLPHAEHLLAAFPSVCGPTHPKPSQLV